MTNDVPTNRFCAIFGHNLKRVSTLDNETNELECKCCGNHFIVSPNDNIMSLTVNDTLSLSNYFENKKTKAIERLMQLRNKMA